MSTARIVLSRLSLPAFFLIVPPTLAGQHEGHGTRHRAEHAHGLGTVVFPNSGSPAAQAPFLRGIALLHSFEYEDAADAFLEAQRIDPGFALAYWGEALTYRHPLWGEEDLEAARAALARLAPTVEARLARAPAARERAYGAAVEALFADAAEGVRALAFADSTRRLLAEYPDDPEAVAFTSLALLGAERWSPPREREAIGLEAARMAERVFRTNPNHPGAAHYMIHAYDHPARAKHGIEAARAYARIAPEAQHALHMPSHIFVQVGLWNEAVSSNERAWAASRAWAARRKASNTELDYHSLGWLHYAYLQQGRLRDARALVDSARALVAGGDFRRASRLDGLYAASRMEFMEAVETGNWSAGMMRDEVPEPSTLGKPGTSARSRSFAATAEHQRAVAAAQRGDPRPADVLARRQRARADSLRAQGRSVPGLESSAALLEALVARAQGDHEGAIRLLREAASHEDEIPAVGPPSEWPAHEALGALLLEAGRPQEALAAYEAALVRRPNRSAALLGLARSRAASGDEAGAREAYGTLLANWSRADAHLPALAETRRAVGDR